MAGTGQLLQVSGIGKHFAGVWVLRDLHFAVGRGEIVILVGENGAGKSTVKNILSGLLEPDGGEIVFAGERFQRLGSSDAGRLGIGTIHQELSLFGNLSVAENVFIGDLPRSRGLVERRRMHEDARSVLKHELGADIDVRAKVDSLSLGERQLVEIAKAIIRSSSLLILDEPTTCLSLPERQRLFAVVRRLKARGYGIIYVTHFMEEVYELADRIVVLRDGVMVGCGTPREIALPELTRLMVGRELGEGSGPPPGLADAPVVLKVDGLDDGQSIRDVSFELRAGEILGLAGLLGAGRSEIAEALVGLRPARGRIELNGRTFDARSPRAARQHGMVLVSEDRRRDQAFLIRPVRENLTVQLIDRIAGGALGWLRPAAERPCVKQMVGRYGVHHPGLEEPMAALSGGNQQKAVIARWFETAPRVCILDEPTKGVDIGAREAVHRLVFELAARGVAMLLISSDLPELLALSHRILVLHKGGAAARFERADATPAAILACASTGRAAA